MDVFRKYEHNILALPLLIITYHIIDLFNQNY